MATKKTISSVLSEIAVAYPKFMEDENKREESIKVWAIYLSDIPDDLLVVAVRKFISSSDHPFAPSIPEIRRMATNLRMEVEKIPTPYEAWEEVVKAPKPRDIPLFRDGKFVPEQPYQWSHEIVQIVSRRLGWPRFPTGEFDMADRSHFIKAYEAELGKVTQQETRLQLVDDYIDSQRNLLLEERSSVFERGEEKFLKDQVRELTRKLS